MTTPLPKLSYVASTGPRLLHFAVDPERLALSRLDDTTELPADVQFACVDRRGQYLFVASSNGGPGRPGDRHYLSAYRLDGVSRRLSLLGEHRPMRHRPIHLCTDRSSTHVLVAYNDPSGVSVHRIEHDGHLGAEVAQPSLDAGVFAHEISVMPSNEAALLVARGNDATATHPEAPGALKLFRYADGRLANWATVAPRGGLGFGPRNSALSCSGRWLIVSLERQNRVCVFRVDGDTVSAEPVCELSTLLEPGNLRPRQMAGAILAHPRLSMVYLANRAFGETTGADRPTFAGGENSIVVYEVDEQSGRLQLVQRVDTEGIYPRTFSLDPTGRMLIVANSRSMVVGSGAAARPVSANLAVCAVASHGLLSHQHTSDIDTSLGPVFWSGLVVAESDATGC